MIVKAGSITVEQEIDSKFIKLIYWRMIAVLCACRVHYFASLQWPWGLLCGGALSS